MKPPFLLPQQLKILGWILLIPCAILGILYVAADYSLFALPAGGSKDGLFESPSDLYDELIGILTIIGGLLVAFCRVPEEDEYVTGLRLDSLVWATYLSYAVLILAMAFLYDVAFWYVMIVNMFTVLAFFIIRFHWQLARFKKSV